jgi:ribosomal protein L11 methyltransferase
MEGVSLDGWTIRFTGYLPVDDRMATRLARVCAELERLPDSAFEVNEEARLITVDYAQASALLGWSGPARGAIRVADRIVVVPPGEGSPPEPDDILLAIDPGAVFGSGLHESTCLCLRALERHAKAGSTAVDFGTGSGILAIAAGKLGLARVIAVDADPEAVAIAAENVRRNQVAEIVEVRLAASLESVSSPVDLVIANLTGALLAEHLGSIARVLGSAGVLIASGMTDHDVGEVTQTLPHDGFRIIEELREGRWVALVALRTTALRP